MSKESIASIILRRLAEIRRVQGVKNTIIEWAITCSACTAFAACVVGCWMYCLGG